MVWGTKYRLNQCGFKFSSKGVFVVYCGRTTFVNFLLVFHRLQEEKLWEEQYILLLKISEENDGFKPLQLPAMHPLQSPSGEGLVHSSTSNLLNLRPWKKSIQKWPLFKEQDVSRNEPLLEKRKSIKCSQVSKLMWMAGFALWSQKN